ncbi:hypothetical protein O181_021739 [Austropuccinia psidii MF-1]|uniref:Uncharacterized protein n=1 Tax=Austropuccinia psidii MF-1 TaxID=1389203 RepID=A0A9Q3CBA2_9BASI|nr:hypothetical protein [Austropuccinia psidii MF-1]
MQEGGSPSLQFAIVEAIIWEEVSKTYLLLIRILTPLPHFNTHEEPYKEFIYLNERVFSPKSERFIYITQDNIECHFASYKSSSEALDSDDEVRFAVAINQVASMKLLVI